MKIGIDGRLWRETGVGRYIRNLVYSLSEIDKKNNYVLFVSSKDYKEVVYLQNLKSANWKIVKTDIRWHSVSEQLKFPKILDRENLDLMHFPYFSVPVIYNRPFVVTIHDLIIDHFPTGKASTLPFPLYYLKRAGYSMVIKKALKKAKKIIVPLFAVKSDLIKTKNVPEDKIEVTYEGVDKRLLNKSDTSISKFGKYFLYVGNAYPHKNLERLIAAFEKFKSGNRTNTKLILVGKSDFFYKGLEAKFKDTQSIIFLHDVSDEELSDLYSYAQALVFPSLMEGFGLPALEAMASGCLVLASDIPSLGEVCQNCALYFDPLNPLSIATQMSEVLENKNSYKKNIEAGLKRVRDFSWKNMTEETLKIYESSVSL